jgi:hypothetical protein
VPILTARLPVARIKERWALYEAGLVAGGHDAAKRARLLAQSALWRNVFVAESDAQAEDELAALLTETRHHMMHVREAFNPPDFAPGPETLNPWTDPKVPDGEAIPYVLSTGSLYGSPKRVREQVAELRDGRRPASALPDRFRRHEPRAEHRFDAAIRRAGDAGLQQHASPERRMILGMSLATFTLVHVLISLVGIATATSVTGFMFPFKAFGPPHMCRRDFPGGAGDRPGRALRRQAERRRALDLCRDGGDGALLQRLRRRGAGVPEGRHPAPAGAAPDRATVRDRAGRGTAALRGPRLHRAAALPADRSLILRAFRILSTPT